MVFRVSIADPCILIRFWINNLQVKNIKGRWMRDEQGKALSIGNLSPTSVLHSCWIAGLALMGILLSFVLRISWKVDWSVLNWGCTSLEEETYEILGRKWSLEKIYGCIWYLLSLQWIMDLIKPFHFTYEKSEVCRVKLTFPKFHE